MWECSAPWNIDFIVSVLSLQAKTVKCVCENMLIFLMHQLHWSKHFQNDSQLTILIHIMMLGLLFLMNLCQEYSNSTVPIAKQSPEIIPYYTSATSDKTSFCSLILVAYSSDEVKLSYRTNFTKFLTVF